MRRGDTRCLRHGFACRQSTFIPVNVRAHIYWKAACALPPCCMCMHLLLRCNRSGSNWKAACPPPPPTAACTYSCCNQLALAVHAACTPCSSSGSSLATCWSLRASLVNSRIFGMHSRVYSGSRGKALSSETIVWHDVWRLRSLPASIIVRPLRSTRSHPSSEGPHQPINLMRSILLRWTYANPRCAWRITSLKFVPNKSLGQNGVSSLSVTAFS